MKLLYFMIKSLFLAKVGLATTFSSVDLYNPNPLLYCTNKPIKDNDLLVAHPTLPCHSKVYIHNIRTNKGVVAVVKDRGPRRALVDLSIGTANKIKSNGMELVLMIPIIKEGK